MKSYNARLKVNVIAVAVQSALAIMTAFPAVVMAEGSEDVAALTNPTNFVEIGAGHVSNTGKDSNKFGEYNGLSSDVHNFGIGNFSIKGGDSYGQGLGTNRWSLTGTDLGTFSREINAGVGSQGAWDFGLGFDQLRHYTTDNYQTPYMGSIGANAFLLPSNFGLINSNGNGTRALTATQVGDFHTQDVYSQRDNTNFAAGYVFNNSWNFKFDYNHLSQSGAKLTGAGTDPSTSFGGISTWGGERILILMTPTEYKTDNFNAAFNWSGDKGTFTGGYYGSLFRDNNSGVSFQNPYQTTSATGTILAAGFPLDTMSTPPSNQFHQLNVMGGYSLTSATKMTGGLSYGRNTQNASYAGTYTPGMGGSSNPTSLNADIVTTHADAKLVHQATKELSILTAIKYDKRDNQTATNLYSFYDEGNKLREAWNTPESNRKLQIELSGDYRFDPKQKVHFGYEYQAIDRWCNNSPSVAQIQQAQTLSGTANWSPTSITNANNYYANGTSCVQVPKDRDDKFVLNYRLKASDSVNFNAGYAYDNRSATINPSFYNPMQSVTQGFENPGYLAFFQAPMMSDLYKFGVSWQATDALNLAFSSKYQKDHYSSTFGVKNGDLAAINLDANLNITETTVLTAYANWQQRQRDLSSAAGSFSVASSGTPSQFWSNNMRTNDTSFGLGARQKELMKGKLELSEDLTYSLGQTDYSTNLLNYTSTSCTPTSNLSCGALPTIRNEMFQFKLAGVYKVDKNSSIKLGYLFQHMNSSDYYYNLYQNGYTASTALPTNQAAPNYDVNVVFVSYIYSFR